MRMTIREFLFETWLWLSDEYEAGTLEVVIQRMRNIINISQERAVQWWGLARRLATRGLIISLLIFLLGMLFGGFMHSGTPNSISGLLIAPLLFVILAWWTPLVAILAVMFEITHRGIGDLAEVAIAQAKWWLGIVGGILLWQVLISLAFTFIPYWNAPSRIPVIILLGLAMSLMGVRWGGLTWGRKIIKTLVVVAFIAQITAFFFPRIAIAVNSLTDKADIKGAVKISTGAWVDENQDRRIEKMSEDIWVVSFKSSNPTEVPILLGEKFLISAPEEINLQWPVMGKPGEYCPVPLNGEITNKVFAKLTLKGEAGKTITIKLL